MTPAPAAHCRLLVLPLLMLLSACGHSDAPAKADEVKKPRNTALPVRVVTVGPGTVVETLGVQGRLEVWRREFLTARVAGVVQEVPVLPNQPVKAGDLLLRLQAPTSDVEAAARAAVKLERAKRELDRREKLMRIAPETMSASDLDAARDLVTDSELEVKIYRQREESRRIVAPYDGVLIMPSSTAAANSQPVTVGQQVNEGFQIADLLDVSRFRLALDLPETSLRRLSAGQAVDLTAISDSTTAKGLIAVLPRAIDSTKGSGRVLVDITVPPASWRPGGFVSARLVLGETMADLALPRDSVLYRENRPYVWVAEEHDGKLVARRAWLELGPGDSGTLVVLTGVSVGEKVVAEGMSGLSDGIPIAIRTADGGTDGGKGRDKAAAADGKTAGKGHPTTDAGH